MTIRSKGPKVLKVKVENRVKGEIEYSGRSRYLKSNWDCRTLLQR